MAALVWSLIEHGVPLVVVGEDAAQTSQVRSAFARQVLADHPTRDAVAGGTLRAGSLEEVLRMTGGAQDGEIRDEARDLGVILVIVDSRLQIAHYVRPVERDAAGHLQRRPPTVLAAWNEQTGGLDHFDWAFSDELATRAGLGRDEFEELLARRAGELAGRPPAGPAPNARH